MSEIDTTSRAEVQKVVTPSNGHNWSKYTFFLIAFLAIVSAVATLVSMNASEKYTKTEKIHRSEIRDRLVGRAPLTSSDISDNGIVRSFLGRDYEEEAKERVFPFDSIEEEFESLSAEDRRAVFDMLWVAGFGGERRTYKDDDDSHDLPYYPDMQNALEDADKMRISSAAAGSEPSYDDRVKMDLKVLIQEFIDSKGQSPLIQLRASSEEIRDAVAASQAAVVEAVTTAGRPILPSEFDDLMEKEVSSLTVPTSWALTADELAIFNEMKSNGNGEAALDAYNTSFAIAVKYLENGNLASEPGVYLKEAIQAALSYHGVSDSTGAVSLPPAHHDFVLSLLRSRFLADR